MTDSKEENEEAKPKAKTIINYVESGDKARFSATIINKEGKINNITEEDDKALKALKRLVNAL